MAECLRSGDHLGERGLKRAVVPQFRKEFSVNKKVDEAVLYVSGLGHYTFRLDGEALDDRFLAPGWTLYNKTCFYNSYDLTDYLNKGEHVLGFTIGNGFFNVNRERYRKLLTAWGYPMLRAKLLVQYRDGSSVELVTNEDWKVTPSPTVYTSIYGGEDYDARLEETGWMEAGFDDAGWQDAVVVAGPGGQMKAEHDYPLKVMQTFHPVSVSRLENGHYLFDFGQNASGIPALTVRGTAGQTVRIIPGELVDELGKVTQQASGGPCYFDYTLSDAAVQKWHPSFTYYGFRYLEIAGAVPAEADNPDQLPVVDQLLFHHTRNSAPSVGSFQCSNELFNRIYDLIDWSVKSNLASVATDCPHREKLGWLEVPHLMGNSLHYMYDISRLYNKIVDDMIDSQLDNGLVPDIAPEYVPFAGGFRDSPEWGSASVILPWLIYEWYGDAGAMHRAWSMMERYMAYLLSRSTDDILSHGLGDWFDLGALTESWPALRYVSNNHMMLGHLMEWFYNGIGGIRQAPGSTAYDKIIIDPYAPGDLTWAKVTFQSIKGKISVQWQIEGDIVNLEFNIPKGTEAEVSFNGQKIGHFNYGNYKKKFPIP